MQEIVDILSALTHLATAGAEAFAQQLPPRCSNSVRNAARKLFSMPEWLLVDWRRR